MEDASSKIGFCLRRVLMCESDPSLVGCLDADVVISCVVVGELVRRGRCPKQAGEKVGTPQMATARQIMA